MNVVAIEDDGKIRRLLLHADDTQVPSLTHDIVELGIRVAVQEGLHPLAQVRLGGARMHGHERLMAIVLYNGDVIPVVSRLQQNPADESGMIGISPTGVGKPLAELGVPSIHDLWKVHNVDEHGVALRGKNQPAHLAGSPLGLMGHPW
ncbi:MAG: hypothetical protein IBX58_19685 [Roseovarius sp.]|nr:hypothetical protein [Roseovarius sp.]